MTSIRALERQVFSAAPASPFMQPDQIEYVIVNRFVTETYNHGEQNKSRKEFSDMGMFGLISDRAPARNHHNGACNSIPSSGRPLQVRHSRLLPKNGRAAMLDDRGAGLLSQIPNNADEDRRKRQ